MEFKQWLHLQERTLYHGTIADYEPSIRQNGLQGGWHGPLGSFVKDAYGGDYEEAGIKPTEDDEIVFLTDKKELSKAVGAMVHHISKKLRKGYHDVTDGDILRNGLLVIVKDVEIDSRWPDDGNIQQRPEDNERRNYPIGVEPGDYFTKSTGADVFLKGKPLIQFLRRMGEMPRNWGKTDRINIDLRRADAIRNDVQKFPLIPKKHIIKTVKKKITLK